MTTKTINIDADDIHWFESAFAAWECNDFAGVLDGLNIAVNHFMPSPTTSLELSVGRMYEVIRSFGYTTHKESIELAEAIDAAYKDTKP